MSFVLAEASLCSSGWWLLISEQKRRSCCSESAWQYTLDSSMWEEAHTTRGDAQDFFDIIIIILSICTVRIDFRFLSLRNIMQHHDGKHHQHCIIALIVPSIIPAAAYEVVFVCSLFSSSFCILLPAVLVPSYSNLSLLRVLASSY